MESIYEKCHVYKGELITLGKTNIDDAKELLKCYSDEKAVPLFNSDNCHGDDFHYTTLERMKEAIEMWNYSYENEHFVRWTIIVNETNEKVGTIEMFHRVANDEFNHCGLLRIDLRSDYEIEKILDDILKVADRFYEVFDVSIILTKAIPSATERIISLRKNGYIPLNKKLMLYGDYFIKEKR